MVIFLVSYLFVGDMLGIISDVAQNRIELAEVLQRRGNAQVINTRTPLHTRPEMASSHVNLCTIHLQILHVETMSLSHAVEHTMFR
jgi:hypothetical protein